MAHSVLILDGDGIGPEIVAEAVKVFAALTELTGVEFESTARPARRCGDRRPWRAASRADLDHG